MSKILKTTATPTLGSSSYESPVATIEDLLSEGVLCTSGQLEEWEEDSINWQQFNY